MFSYKIVKMFTVILLLAIIPCLVFSDEYSMLIEKGKTELNHKNYLAAKDTFLSALGKKAEESECYIYLGIAYQNLKFFKEALGAYQNAINFNEKNDKAYLHLGNLFLDILNAFEEPSKEVKENLLKKAVKAYTSAIQLNPKLPQAHDMRGHCLEQAEKYELAYKDYEKSIKIDPNRAYPFYGLGNIFNAQNKFKESIICFDKAIKLDKDFDLPLYGLARALINDGKKDLAIYYLKSALKLNPYLVVAANELGLILDELGYFEAAIQALNHSISVMPYYFTAYDSLGKILENRNYTDSAAEHYYKYGNRLIEKRKYTEATQAFENAIRIRPEFFQAMNNLGTAYYWLKDYNKAIDSYQNALKLEKKNPEIYYNLGNAFLGIKEYDNATASYEQAIKLKPDYVEAIYNLGTGKMRAKEYDKAIDTFDEIVGKKDEKEPEKTLIFAKAPKFYKAYNNKGISQFQKNEVVKSIDSLMKALKYRSEDPELWYNLGNTFWEDGKLRYAVWAFDKAIFLKPNYIMCKETLANLYFGIHEFKKAKEIYLEIVTNYPNYENTKEIKNKIKNIEKKILE